MGTEPAKPATEAQGPSGRRRGRPPKLSAEQEALLVEHVRGHRQATLDELCAWVLATCGTHVDRATVAKCLKRHGITKRRPPKRTPAPKPDSSEPSAAAAADAPAIGKARYGYRDHHRIPGDASTYPCSVTDAEWARIGALFSHTGAGKPPEYDRRALLDAIFYVVRGGVAWRMLPKDFPLWQNVYATFRRWTAQGRFEKMYDELRLMARERAGRAAHPTGAVLDAQSTRTSPQGSPAGYDAGKKVKGRKRHLLVDTLGLLLTVIVTPADVQDRDAVGEILGDAKKKHPTIERVYGDSAYAGAKAQAAAGVHGIVLDIVRRPRDGNGTWTSPTMPFTDDTARPFPILPKRWIVERNNAWDERPRRMNRDHDRLLAVSTSWIWVLQGQMLLRRMVANL